MPNNDMQESLKKYGIFFGVLFGMAAVLLCFILLAHNSWRHGLSLTVQHTLDFYYPDSYVVGEYHELDSVLATSAVVYTVKPKKATSTELSAFAVLLRIPTLAGAEPALFLYNARYGAQFVGYALTVGKAEAVLNKDVEKSSLSYWQQQIPIVLEKAGLQ